MCSFEAEEALVFRLTVRQPTAHHYNSTRGKSCEFVRLTTDICQSRNSAYDMVESKINAKALKHTYCTMHPRDISVLTSAILSMQPCSSFFGGRNKH